MLVKILCSDKILLNNQSQDRQTSTNVLNQVIFPKNYGGEINQLCGNLMISVKFDWDHKQNLLK